MLRFLFYGTLIVTTLQLLAGCAYTDATHDYAKSVGQEWFQYDKSDEGKILLDSVLSDNYITLDEARSFDAAITPEYLEYITDDDTLSDFDLRIRLRYVDDFGTLIERGE